MSPHAPRARSARSTLLTGLLVVSAPAVVAQETNFDCVIDPSRIIKVSSPDIGLLAEVLAERGDKVAKGQVLARLESAVESRTVALRKAQAEATSQVEAQQEQLNLARKTYERGTQMAGSNAISRQEIDELAARVRINELELARVELERELARLEFERARAVLDKRTIRSPIAGVVTGRQLSAGEYVDNDTYILEIAQLDPLYVEAFLPIALFTQVGEGMKALVELKEPFSGRHEARILTVDRVFDSASGTFGVRLELINHDQRLPAGLRCQVAFAVDAGSVAEDVTAQP